MLDRPIAPRGTLSLEDATEHIVEFQNLAAFSWLGMLDSGALSTDSLTVMDANLAALLTGLGATSVYDYFNSRACFDPLDSADDSDGDGIPGSMTKKLTCSDAVLVEDPDSTWNLSASGRFVFSDTNDDDTAGKGLNRGYDQIGSVVSSYSIDGVLQKSQQYSFAKEVLAGSKSYRLSNDGLVVSRTLNSDTLVYRRLGSYFTVKVTPTSLGSGPSRDAATLLGSGTINSIVGFVELREDDINVILTVEAEDLVYNSTDCSSAPYIKEGSLSFKDERSNVVSVTYAACVPTYKFNEQSFTP
jgi:hypothetical protein